MNSTSAGIKITIPGMGNFVLDAQNFLAQGGEGAVHLLGDKVVKVYHDRVSLIPRDKIAELQQIARDNVLTPLDPVFDMQNRRIGFTMPHVPDSLPLAQLFSNAYWRRHGVKVDAMLELAARMAETLRHIHSHDCLVVDGNELNTLASRDLKTPHVIDTDSFQTPSFLATAQMPSIRDYHGNGFTRDSDWFAYAVVICQLLLGIHPYKGRHPGFGNRDLQGRMQANRSIFHADTRLPAAARDRALLPRALHGWMEQVFEKGERKPPPDLIPTAPKPVVQAVVLRSTKQLHVERLHDFSAPIVAHRTVMGREITLLPDAFVIDGRTYSRPTVARATATRAMADSQLIFTPVSGRPLAVYVDGDRLVLRDLAQDRPVAGDIAASRVLVEGNHLFTWHAGRLNRLLLREMNGHLHVGIMSGHFLSEHGTTLFDGFLHTVAMAKPVISFISTQGSRVAHSLARPLAELKGYRLVDGSYKSGVLVVCGYHGESRRLDRLTFLFDESGQLQRMAVEEGIDHPLVNFTVLDNGIVVRLHHDGVLEIFHRSGEGLNKIKRVEDTLLRADMVLCHSENQVRFFVGDQLFRMTLQGG